MSGLRQIRDELFGDIVATTSARRVVGIISLIGVLLLPFVLIFLQVHEAGFTPSLLVAFVLCLCMTHGYYAFKPKLSQRRVRKIDYWYLGAASVGMIMFAITYEDQRAVALGKTREFLYLSEEETIRSVALDRANRWKAVICGASIMSLSEKACEFANSYIPRMQPNLTAKEIAELAAEMRVEHAKMYRSNLKGKDLDIGPEHPMFVTFAHVFLGLRDWAQFVDSRPSTEHPTPKQSIYLPILLSLAQTIIWPFLLAFALALRIAKVTIDVFGWAEG